MATYVEILKSEFPEIDSELFDYITGERPGSQPLSARDRVTVCCGQRYCLSAVHGSVLQPGGALHTGLKQTTSRQLAAVSC